MDDYFDNKMSTISIHAPREGGDNSSPDRF